MNIQKINSQTFQAKYNEKQIIAGVTRIIQDESKTPLVRQNFEYFQDMLKGSSIAPARKAEIDQWIKDTSVRYSTFNENEEERKTREYIEFQKNRGLSNLERRVYRFTDKLKKAFLGDDIYSHPLMKAFEADRNNAWLFKHFGEFFNSYLELVPKGETKTPIQKKDISNDRFISQIQEIAEVKQETNQLTKLNITETMEQSNNPKRLIGINETQAARLLKEFFDLREWCSNNISAEKSNGTFAIGKGAHKVFLEEFRPLEKRVQEHNISIIQRKEFTPDQTQEIHDYIHYEVLPNVRFNEATYFDALEMFEKYGKREEYIGISTLVPLKNALPENPTEIVVNKLIKLFGKHADNFVYPDERDGAENSISYAQNYLQILWHKNAIRTEEQAQLALENGRRIFWRDDQIDKMADVWMVDKDAPLKGNEKVKKIIDQMFECAAKNREPYKNDENLQYEMQFWNVNKRYKNS